MKSLEDVLKMESFNTGFILGAYTQSDCTLLDLSISNEDLKDYEITTPDGCQNYIDNVLKGQGKKVAFGGYLEQRAIYGNFDRFGNEEPRNLHLGMDFWCHAGTQVLCPLQGKVHSFKNNHDMGNYGPTIILEHVFGSILFYSLYGHLSLESLDGLYKGKELKNGEILGTLGTPDINVNYAPHLHFQLIRDLQGYEGDYPGVCSHENLGFYKKNCPNPNLLFQLEI